MNKIPLRPAIAMIELIFAIVIMGIILMSAPMLISTATKSGYVAIQQEAINEAASQVNMIMGYHWDENSADEMYLDPLLHVSNGHVALDEAGTTSRRIGTPNVSYRTFARSDGKDFNATLVLNGVADAGETEKDDIDDFAGSTNLIEIDFAGLVDNVEKTTINIATAISYSGDAPVGAGGYNQPTIPYNPFTASGGTTNIKSIMVTLTSVPSATVATVPDELDKEIILRAFSCNIGGYNLEERDF